MYYVYELIDPRDSKPFYVGKGKGDRVHQHEKDAKAGATLGRFDRINEIWAAGFKVEKRIVARFEDEEAAYAAESARIAEIGRENLTNWTRGAGLDPTAPQDRELAKSLLKIAAKTNWFRRKSFWWFGGKRFQLPMCALLVFANHMRELEKKRGRDWVRAYA